MRWLDGITNSKDMNLNKLQEIVRDRKVHGVAKTEQRQQNIACFWESFMYKLILYHPREHPQKTKYICV